jgi:hypothetical protein
MPPRTSTYPSARVGALSSSPKQQEAVMRGAAFKTILAATIAGAGLLVAAQADAHDHRDKWDRWEDRHHHRHWHDHDRPRHVVERPVIIERARPTPVYMAPMPMMPAYPPQDPSVNFNFSFPR